MLRAAPRTTGLAYAALAVADTWLAGQERHGRARWVTKPALMPVLAAHLAARRRTPLTPTTLAAEGLSWVGDVALMRPTQAGFLGGVGGFALAHVATLAGLRRHLDRSQPLLGRRSTRRLGVVLALAAPPLALSAGRKDPVLGVAVGGYAALLVTMAAHAAALDPALPVAARRLTAAGALVFVVSDGTLATHEFVLAEKRPWLHHVVMGTYTLAQWLIAEGAARA